jgi:hypothetical protein
MRAELTLALVSSSEAELQDELDRQVENLIRKGYPQLAGMTMAAFRRCVAPLGERIAELPGASEAVPFVLVVAGAVAAERAMPLVELDGKQGFTRMEADELARFRPIEGVELPGGFAYLVADVDTGGDTLNVTPDDALETIAGRGRSPLTIDEGIALVTQFPEVLRTRNCFSMLGSRCGDRRVTAMWISARRPRLGWCWAGNPHTWLGSASCGGRLGA